MFPAMSASPCGVVVEADKLPDASRAARGALTEGVEREDLGDAGDGPRREVRDEGQRCGTRSAQNHGAHAAATHAFARGRPFAFFVV